jgi:hypothetical protein
MEQRDRILKRAASARARMDMEAWVKLVILAGELRTMRGKGNDDEALADLAE